MIFAIRSDEAYSLENFLQIVGWGNAALRSARRNGLKVRYTQGRAYVIGKEAIEYLQAQPHKPVAGVKAADDPQ